MNVLHDISDYPLFSIYKVALEHLYEKYIDIPVTQHHKFVAVQKRIYDGASYSAAKDIYTKGTFTVDFYVHLLYSFKFTRFSKDKWFIEVQKHDDGIWRYTKINNETGKILWRLMRTYIIKNKIITKYKNVSK